MIFFMLDSSVGIDVVHYVKGNILHGNPLLLAYPINSFQEKHEANNKAP